MIWMQLVKMKNGLLDKNYFRAVKNPTGYHPAPVMPSTAGGGPLFHARNMPKTNAVRLNPIIEINLFLMVTHLLLHIFNSPSCCE